MPKLLGLYRHAKSDWGDGAARDFDRGLNERGVKGAELMGDHLRAHGVEWDLSIASPAVRVKDTLDKGLPEMSVKYDERLYLASADTIIETTQEHAAAYKDEQGEEPEAILVSGHNPGLQEVILELVSPSHETDLFREASVKFPTASFAVIECNVDSWDAVKKYVGKLTHFTRPRDLDPELGPQH